MDPLTVNAVSPVTLNALSALRRVQSVVDPAPAALGLALPNPAQSLFQQALQVSAVAPLAAANASTATTAPAATPAPAVAQGAPPAGDAFATGTSLDFALQTALRFGAGVVAAGAPALAAPNLATGLVRDATAVPRMGNLQPREGGPGPEAFTRPQATTRQVLQSYQPPPAPQGPGQLDLLI